MRPRVERSKENCLCSFPTSVGILVAQHLQEMLQKERALDTRFQQEARMRVVVLVSDVNLEVW